MSVSVRDAMNSLGYNEQQARNSKAAYDVMGTCEWLLDRERALRCFERLCVHASISTQIKVESFLAPALINQVIDQCISTALLRHFSDCKIDSKNVFDSDNMNE